ncbi:FGGY-family carbohydrate kinase [Lachnospiraceae bacterium MD308]|nr:FGGY-family carbohydrate kinase [Lachnospiraceae bacterium MD308]MCI8579142.1 FGGY-family carbohydrate kinase [Dorea sp.]
MNNEKAAAKDRITEGKKAITEGKTALGIELGSTRIKGVLIDFKGHVLAVGIYDWENSFVDNIWTYGLEEIHTGVRECYSSLRKAVEDTYGIVLQNIGAMGVSAMMHGYMALDKEGRQIAPFQTWRNTNTQKAADELTELFDFNIPLRWSVAHLYQRILDGEEHVKNLDYVSTLSGYIHWKLTGKRVIGIGDASGMFPIDSEACGYDVCMADKFDKLIEPYGYSWKLRDIFPEVLTAGEQAGTLTDEGAAFLDETGSLKPGIRLCPPEGDAGTGMTATNSVAPRTGNVSAGTSTFAMVVLEKKLSKVYREIDMVTTPTGFPCAMSHANNGTSDLNAWVSLFGEFAEMMGIKAGTGELFEKLYTRSLEGDKDCGGLLAYGYYSGENITMINEGRLAFLRTAESRFNLANFMRVHLYTSLGAVKLGLDILMDEEQVKVDRIMGHGGFFKTKGVGQRYLAAAAGAPVTVMDTASEGGAWGIALLAAYLADKTVGERLEDYLETRIFRELSGETVIPDERDTAGFHTFMERYKAGLSVEKAAIEAMDW